MRTNIILTSPIRNRRIFITGFHGIGLVGYISVRHLISTLPSKRVGFLELVQEPANCAYAFNTGRLTTPGELYHDETNGVTLFLAYWGLPGSERAVYSFVKTLARWVVMNGYEVAVLFGGLDSEARGDDPSPLRIVTTTTYKLRGYATCGAKDMEVNFFVVGPLALLLNEFERMDFPAIAILPYASKWRADPSAALVGLEFFSNCFGVKVDVEKLREIAAKYEEELREMRRLLEEEQRKREGAPYYI